MAEIKWPIQVDLPDDWIEQIVNRLRNDPDAEWAEIVRCKECVYASKDDYTHCPYVTWWNSKDDFCSRGKRRTDGV